MSNKLIPLYYAILKHFLDVEKDSAEGVMEALGPLYKDYKLFTKKDIDEALATAKENGLLDEVFCDLDANNDLRIFYSVNDFGKDMIVRYIGKYNN